MPSFSDPVLVVSASDAARRLLHLLLGRAGYGSVEARDGDEALDFVRQKRPPLVVIDLRDPDEAMLVFAGLLQKRYPALPRLMLHVGKARLASGASEREFALGSPQAPEHFPSIDELRRAVDLAISERVLAVLKPVTAKA